MKISKISQNTSAEENEELSGELKLMAKWLSSKGMKRRKAGAKRRAKANRNAGCGSCETANENQYGVMWRNHRK
jgi:hypothetical protein